MYPGVAATLLPIMGVVFVPFLAIGVAMPVLPLHVHDGGFSLVYPGFGVETVRRVAPQSRGLAMGAYTAFLDLAQGLASPALGLIAAGARLNALFLASSAAVLCASLVARWLIAHPMTLGGSPR
ncbi:hypothetical protein [Bradyrhizobium sp. 180]|uniref:hypothetical protein n=1 Tax=Bradyrhizobium sp. 180 TaxID=2782650 RepID=UPI001FF73C76|nr:hypothetical protein [Bradyrhizobium sp. 180]